MPARQPPPPAVAAFFCPEWTPPLTDTDHRLTELEIRLALQDELIDSLNLALNRQQQQLDLQQQQLRQLYAMLQQPAGDAPEGGSLLAQLQQDIPPHY